MWKKESKDDTSAETSAADPETRPRFEGKARAGADTATIGRSIEIRGEVTGDEDLVIQGHLDGSVHLQQQAVTVGSDGNVKADITARVITVEGRVQGDLTAEEQIVLRSSARVQGDIEAPRVVLEDGARFRGGVDMGDPSEREPRTDGRAPSTGRATSRPAAAKPNALGSSTGKKEEAASDSGAEVTS